jgi:hypothetical protein
MEVISYLKTHILNKSLQSDTLIIVIISGNVFIHSLRKVDRKVNQLESCESFSLSIFFKSHIHLRLGLIDDIPQFIFVTR